MRLSFEETSYSTMIGYMERKRAHTTPISGVGHSYVPYERQRSRENCAIPGTSVLLCALAVLWTGLRLVLLRQHVLLLRAGH